MKGTWRPSLFDWQKPAGVVNDAAQVAVVDDSHQPPIPLP
jgi:hypothetical protein